jgi:hypothetical protein
MGQVPVLGVLGKNQGVGCLISDRPSLGIHALTHQTFEFVSQGTDLNPAPSEVLNRGLAEDSRETTAAASGALPEALPESAQELFIDQGKATLAVLIETQKANQARKKQFFRRRSLASNAVHQRSLQLSPGELDRDLLAGGAFTGSKDHPEAPLAQDPSERKAILQDSETDWPFPYGRHSHTFSWIFIHATLSPPVSTLLLKLAASTALNS